MANEMPMCTLCNRKIRSFSEKEKKKKMFGHFHLDHLDDLYCLAFER